MHLNRFFCLKQHKAFECLFPPLQWENNHLLGLESSGVGSESPEAEREQQRGLPRAWMGKEQGLSSWAQRALRICARGCSCGWESRCLAHEGHLDQASEKSQGRKAEEFGYLCKLQGVRLGRRYFVFALLLWRGLLYLVMWSLIAREGAKESPIIFWAPFPMSWFIAIGDILGRCFLLTGFANIYLKVLLKKCVASRLSDAGCCCSFVGEGIRWIKRYKRMLKIKVGVDSW